MENKFSFFEMELPEWNKSLTEIKNMQHKPVDQNDVILAKLAAEKSYPQTYQIVGHENKPFSILVMGCQGTGTQTQEEAAFLLNKIATSTSSPPLFIIFLGDNLYDYGASSPDDDQFYHLYYKMYGGETFKQTDPLPGCLVLGNHDGNYHHKSFLSSHPIGCKTEMNQIAHSYLPDHKYLTVSEKIAFYNRQAIQIKDMPKWNMPYFYYSIIVNDTQFFFLNSNSYAKDYLASLTYIGDSNLNQALWFKQEYEKAKNAKRKIIVASHHPLYTSGKRSFPIHYDSLLYLTETEINQLDFTLNINTHSYNELLKKIREKQNIHVDLDLVAHDHAVSYFNNKLNEDEPFKICQLTAGGGGQDLQGRESFLAHPYVSCYLKQHGCAKILIDPNKKEIDFEIFTVLGHHLTFSTKNHLPIANIDEDFFIHSTELFKNTIQNICLSYLNHLKKQEKKIRQKELGEIDSSPQQLSMIQSGYNLFSRIKNTFYPNKAHEKEIYLLHDLWAFINQPKLPDLLICLQYIDDLCLNLPNKFDKNSFYTLLTEQFMNKSFLWNIFGIDLDHIHDIKHLAFN